MCVMKKRDKPFGLSLFSFARFPTSNVHAALRIHNLPAAVFPYLTTSALKNRSHKIQQKTSYHQQRIKDDSKHRKYIPDFRLSKSLDCKVQPHQIHKKAKKAYASQIKSSISLCLSRQDKSNQQCQKGQHCNARRNQCFQWMLLQREFLSSPFFFFPLFLPTSKAHKSTSFPLSGFLPENKPPVNGISYHIKQISCHTAADIQQDIIHITGSSLQKKLHKFHSHG